jgi:hypothetical protein
MSTATLELLTPETEKARDLYPPLLCEVCGEVLVEAMAEDGRDELIESLTGETIMYTTAQRCCWNCYLNDDTESPYIKADYYR